MRVATTAPPCPSWDALLEHRYDPNLPEPADWQEAKRHLEDCPDCQSRAYELDPTLAFQQLPEIELDSSEIESMKRSVAVLRRGSALNDSLAAASPSLGRSLRDRLPQAVNTTPFRAAAALALGVGLVFGIYQARETASPDLAGSPDVAATGSTAGALALAPTPAASDAADSWLGSSFDDYGPRAETALEVPSLRDETPVVEAVENPAARVYHFQLPETLRDEEVDIAWVIDPTLGG